MKTSRVSGKYLLVIISFFLSLLIYSNSFGEIVDRVVAKVNGDIITLSSLGERVSIIHEQMMVSGADPSIPENEIVKKALDTIIEEKLQLQEAKKSSLEVDGAAVDKALNEIKQKNNISDEELEAMLVQEGRNMEQYRERIRNQILVSKVTQFNMGNRDNVNEKQIQKYYRSHQNDYWQPRQPYVRHILFILEEGMTEEAIRLKEIKVKEVLRQIRLGKDFVEMAKTYSEDVSASSGGDIGFVKKGQLVKEFEEVAFLLKPGEISDVVKTQYGFHIIKVDKVIPGRTLPLDEVKSKIRSILSLKGRQKRYKEWIDELKKDALIEISLFKRDGQNDSSEFGFADDADAGNENRQDDVKNSLAHSGKESQWEEAANVKRSAPALRDKEGKIKFEAMEKKLSQIKMLRKNKKISEEEYQNRKQRLLDQL